MKEDVLLSKIKQQDDAIDSILNAKKNIAVKTFSNALQTEIILGVAKKYSDKNPLLYIVANNKEKEEAESFFLGNNIIVKSVYALAKQYISPDDKIRGNYTGGEIAERMGHKEAIAWKAVKLLSSYCNSTGKDFQMGKQGAILAKEIYRKMREGELQKTFSFCLKEFQLNLLSGKYNSMPFPAAIISKFDSKNPLIRSLFKTLPLDKKVLFWQSHTGINSFNRGVNFPYSKRDAYAWDRHTLLFTDEVSSKVSRKANAILKHFMGETELMIGTRKEFSPKNGLLLSKTNILMVDAAVRYAQKNIHFKMLRDVDKSFSLPISILQVESKGKINNQKYDFLENEFKIYCGNKKGCVNFGEHMSKKGQHEKDSELVWAGAIASKYSLSVLKDAHRKAKINSDSDTEVNYFVSTIHSLGEKKFDFVSLSEDISDPISIVAKWYANADIEPTKKECLQKFVEYYKNEGSTYVTQEINLVYCAIMSGKVDTIFHDNMRDISLMSSESINNAIYDEYKNIIINESKKKEMKSRIKRYQKR